MMMLPSDAPARSTPKCVQTLAVDRKLLDEVVKTIGERSKSAAVNRALEEYVRRTKIDELRAMSGKFRLDDTRVEQRAADRRRQAFLDDLKGS